MATIALLATCLTLHQVRLYVLISLYMLSASCFAGFGAARFAPALFGWFAGAIGVMLTITGGILTVENYRRPLSADDRDAINQRIVYWVVPVLAIILTLWFFDKRTATYVQDAMKTVDHKVNTVIQTSKKLEKTVQAISHADSVRADSTAKANAKLLDGQQQLSEKATDNNLLLQRVHMDQQKKSRR